MEAEWLVSSVRLLVLSPVDVGGREVSSYPDSSIRSGKWFWFAELRMRLSSPRISWVRGVDIKTGIVTAAVLWARLNTGVGHGLAQAAGGGRSDFWSREASFRGDGQAGFFREG